MKQILQLVYQISLLNHQISADCRISAPDLSKKLPKSTHLFINWDVYLKMLLLYKDIYLNKRTTISNLTYLFIPSAASVLLQVFERKSLTQNGSTCFSV